MWHSLRPSDASKARIARERPLAPTISFAHEHNQRTCTSRAPQQRYQAVQQSSIYIRPFRFINTESSSYDCSLKKKKLYIMRMITTSYCLPQISKKGSALGTCFCLHTIYLKASLFLYAIAGMQKYNRKINAMIKYPTTAVLIISQQLSSNYSSLFPFFSIHQTVSLIYWPYYPHSMGEHVTTESYASATPTLPPVAHHPSMIDSING